MNSTIKSNQIRSDQISYDTIDFGEEENNEIKL